MFPRVVKSADMKDRGLIKNDQTLFIKSIWFSQIHLVFNLRILDFMYKSFSL